MQQNMRAIYSSKTELSKLLGLLSKKSTVWSNVMSVYVHHNMVCVTFCSYTKV